MKIISIVRSLFEPVSVLCAAGDEDRRRWRLDPLSHPDLDAMSPRELGDVPLRSARIEASAV